MHRFDMLNCHCFSELPLAEFDKLKFSVYAIDREWNYLFVNEFVRTNLGPKGDNLVGKNMWDTFPELRNDPAFSMLRNNSEKGIATDVVTTSPINSQRLKIVGRSLDDCYLFFSYILPNKEDLLSELRNEIRKSEQNAATSR